MKIIKLFFITSFCLLVSFVHAEESSIDKIKEGVTELWDETKDKTKNVAGELSESASEIGQKASKTSVIVWDSMKEVGAATSESIKKGASKIRQLSNDEKKTCQKESTLCFKDKK